MPEFLQPLFGDSPRAAAIFWAVVGSFAFLTLLILWQLFGHGPRRRRGLKRAMRRLAEGAWQDAIERVRKLRNFGFPSPRWKKRFNEAEAECLRTAAKQALTEKKFEDALGHLLRISQVLGEPEVAAKIHVQSAMLEEVRRLFSVGTLGDNAPVHDLIGRIMLVQSPCREASFWQGLCFIRSGEFDRALQALHTARSGEGKSLVMDDALGDLAQPNPIATATSTHIDPPLYLGALLLRQGQAKDALKYLTEANRIDGNCPVVTIQLGAAMIAAGGDTQLAVRALQRGLGPRGLGTWPDNPRKAWVEGFPEGRSYVRKLAAAYPYPCPLWGGDLNLLTQQGNLALAQAMYKLAAYAEAAELYTKVLQNGAPSLVVLRGLGLSLARLGKYDEAFKHLFTAHEMEEPKDRVTAGYLALCGAKGKPKQAGDKARNIEWAIKVVTQFNAPGDREWVALIGALFAEARAENVPLGRDDQFYLCEHLLSTNETDPQAAQAYHYLQATNPQAVHDEYAWLFCRAAQQHKVEGAYALNLFARAFANIDAARAFFTQRGWDWDDVEFTFLERAAILDPGHFPAILGADYPPKGEEMLLARAHKQEQSQAEAALATVEILYKLAPTSARALDRLAYLHHRRGQDDRAVQLLEAWFTSHPRDPRPVVRFAMLLQRRGLLDDCRAKLREAMHMCDGPLRARIAFLGARLTLQSALPPASAESNGSPGLDEQALAAAEDFLHLCLRDDPDHADAQWCLAATRWLRGDRAGLARQATTMTGGGVDDVRYQFFAALCRLAAEDFAGVQEVCARIAVAQPASGREPPLRNGDVPRVNWPAENAYLAGLALLGSGQHDAAAAALAKPAAAPDSPSTPYAQGLLGAIAFDERRHEEAARWWQALDPKKRVAWKLGETLAHTVFQTALEAHVRGAFEEAAEKLRAAGKLGCRDRRLGSLLVLSLFKAGQKLMYGGV